MLFDDKKINKKYKDMTPEEKAICRRAKRLRRRIQVYCELGGIVLILVIGVFFVVGRFTKHDSTNEEPLQIADSSATTVESSGETAEDSEGGLKVKPTAVDPDELAREEEEKKASAKALFSAEETDATASISSSEVLSEYGILINLDTNKIVAKKNCYDQMVPASMTKVMTVYTAYKHITDAQLADKVTISDEAVSECYRAGCSTSGFVAGEEVTVKDLFYGTILPSGGDAAVQLAMYVSGDTESFVKLMNEDLKELGLSKTTHFTNPIGYFDPDHYSTAYDIAMIFEASLQDDFLKELLSTHVYDSSSTNVNPEGITISNWFLRRIEDKSFGGTIEGAKTGYVDESGSCAVSSEISDSGVHYICCTGKSQSSWKCIGDHVKIYSDFGK